MQASLWLDVAGGVLTQLFGLGIVAILLSLVISGVESVVLWGMKWGGFTRSLFVALLSNAISTVFGLGSMEALNLLNLSNIPEWAIALGAFPLSVWIEGWFLQRFKPGNPRENWKASLAGNTASHLLVVFPAITWLAYVH